MEVMVDWASLAPRGLKANCRYRRRLLELAEGDQSLQDDLWVACSRDPVFFCNSFCWTYGPNYDEKKCPFVLWEFQEKALRAICAALGKHDLCIPKSREVGATWICTVAFVWAWLFREGSSLLMASRIEDLVDKPENPKALFPKVDLLLALLPWWLRPKHNRTYCHLYNHENDSLIHGSSTQKDLSRGGRDTAILLDEFAAVKNGREILAATLSTTKCRIFNSTPQGTGTAFHDVWKNDAIPNVTLHWTDHPVFSQGMYRDGVSGKMRSPWYDDQCKRAGSDRIIAQELDIDFSGSGARFFRQDTLDRIEREDIRDPLVVGELQYDETGRPRGFVETNTGRIRLWIHPDVYGVVGKSRRFIVGCDISAGTGASNSAAIVMDRDTGEKVCELVVSDMYPTDFGTLCLALARWFTGSAGEDGGAHMIWEANGGPGRAFGDRVVGLGYRNVYWRPSNDKSVDGRQSLVPGFWSQGASRQKLLNEYAVALRDGLFVERSRACLREHEDYEYIGQTVQHSSASNSDDASGANDNHGDRVIGNALCWQAKLSVDGVATRRTEDIVRTRVAPVGSIAWVMEENRRTVKAASAW